jgi:inorganic triphosphatase YgiF
MTEVAGGAPLEIELKYRMTDAATGDRLLAAEDLAGLAAAAPAETVVHEDRYVDTLDGALAAAGYAGRFRSSGDATVITLKGLRRQDRGGAAHRREELEGPADLESAATNWPESPARDAVISIVGDATLGELVRVRQVRRKRNYAANGTVVELSVDDVEVVMGDRVIERFAELEVELRQGDEAALEPLVDLLSEIEELVPAETSKLERAMEAVPARPSRATASRTSLTTARRLVAWPGSRSWISAPMPPTGSLGPRPPGPASRSWTPSPSPSRRGSSSPRRPASSPTTTWPRRPARFCDSTSPG